MSDTKQLITQLNGRVDQLINRIAESNQLTEQKNAQIAMLNNQVLEKDAIIAKLQNEISAMKEEKAQASNQENEELKSRINEMVREIDECISLLKVGN